MTNRMAARKRKIPVDHVRVTLTHDRTHSDDCADPDVDSCRVEVLHRSIEVSGDLDDDQRATILDIADRCPVHRTLAVRPAHHHRARPAVAHHAPGVGPLRPFGTRCDPRSPPPLASPAGVTRWWRPVRG